MRKEPFQKLVPEQLDVQRQKMNLSLNPHLTQKLTQNG